MCIEFFIREENKLRERNVIVFLRIDGILLIVLYFIELCG